MAIDGAEHDEHDERQAALIDRLERDVAQPRSSVIQAMERLGIQAGQRVLDAGCGPGTHLGLFARLAGQDGRVIGLDPSVDNVEAANAFWSRSSLATQITVERGGMPDIPEHLTADGAFDLAWSSLVFHHLPRAAESVAALASVVKPGGTVAVLDGDAGPGFPMTVWPADIEVMLRSAMVRADSLRQGSDPLSDVYLPFAARWIPGYMISAGLADVRVEVVSDAIVPPLSIPDLEEILGWLRVQATRLAEFLAPRDLATIADLFDPESPRYMLSRPGFFWLRTGMLVVGTVPHR